MAELTEVLLQRLQRVEARLARLEAQENNRFNPKISIGAVGAGFDIATSAGALNVTDVANNATRASVDSAGFLNLQQDVRPFGVQYGFGHRLINVAQTPDTHFASASIPTGYAWAGAPFDGTPVALIYNANNEYMVAVANSSSGRVFLNRPITNAAAAWQNKSLYGRFKTGTITEVGLRVDDGTDNNYGEVFVTGALQNGMQRLDWRSRTGGGSVTTLSSAIIVPTDTFLALRLYCVYSGGVYTLAGYLVAEDGGAINLGMSVTATAFLPAAGRAGILVKQNNGNFGYCDWLKNEFG